jgi:hypothetical protein
MIGQYLGQFVQPANNDPICNGTDVSKCPVQACFTGIFLF